MNSYVPVKLAYNTFEPASGLDASLPPVIFLHGATISKENWGDLPQIVANETKRKVYTVDARNHGDSEWSDSFDLDMNTDDLFHFMDTMNVVKAVLIGHSMGGMTSIKTALKKPERVEKLVVEDMFVKKPSKEFVNMIVSHVSLLNKAVKEVPAGLSLEEAQNFVAKYIFDSLPEELKEEAKSSDDNSKFLDMKKNSDGRYVFKANMEVIEQSMRNPETTMSDPEGLYDGPACFIYGEKSMVHVGDEVPHIKQFFPNAEFVCIKDGMHTLHMEKSEEFTEAVVKFLTYDYVPVKLAYNTFEPALGLDESLPPVIFVHGATLSKECWGDLPRVVANETKRKVYAVDARNHGDSEWSDNFDFRMNVDDLFHFMDKMSVAKAIFIGHSMGGMTVIKAALKKPERVEKLVVEDAFVRKPRQEFINVGVSHLSLLNKAIKEIPAGLTLEEAQQFLKNCILDSVPEELKKEMKSADDNMNFLEMKKNSDGRYAFKANVEAVEKAMRSFQSISDPEGLYEGLACFIYGENSPLRVGDEAPHIRQFFPNAEFVCIKDGMHSPHMEKPKEFTEALVKFLISDYVPVKLAYNTFEPASDVDASLPPVIFLHGATVTKENWDDIPQIVADETKRKVYAVDARNHGDSEWSDIFNFDINADDLFHFMDTMSVAKAALIGHSMGGITSIKAALKKPERVEKLVVEDMFVKKPSEELINTVIAFVSVIRKTAPDVPLGLSLEEAEKFAFNRILDSLPEDFKKEIKSVDANSSFLQMKKNSDGRYVFKTNLDVIEKAMRNYETIMSDPEGLYDGPASFIYGEVSQFNVGDEVPHIKQFFPNAEFVCIEAATHGVHLDKRKEFIEAVVKFLSSK